MRDTRVVLTFGDPKFDVLLHPFGLRGYEPTGRELIDQSRARTEKSQGLKVRTRALLAAVLQSIAAMKEIRKRLPFKQRPVDEE